jgi:hypothetical protein
LIEIISSSSSFSCSISSSILLITVVDKAFAFRCSRCRRRFSDERSTARVIVGDIERFICCLELLDVEDNERTEKERTYFSTKHKLKK